MARLRSTETLDETYELAVHLERVATFRAAADGFEFDDKSYRNLYDEFEQVMKHHVQ
jgi:hypothetical protein